MTQACALPGTDAAAFTALPFFFSTFLETGSPRMLRLALDFLRSSQSLPPKGYDYIDVYHHPRPYLPSALLW